MEVCPIICCPPLQPIVVHSSLGAGRAGCFVAVSVAKLLMDSHSECVAWDADSNLLDQVCVHVCVCALVGSLGASLPGDPRAAGNAAGPG